MAVEAILKLGNVVGRPAAAGAMTRDIVKSVSEIETGLGAWSKLRFRVFCPVWKNPWISLSMADTLCRTTSCGCSASTTSMRRPASAIHASRLAEAPRTATRLCAAADSEPYEFDAKDVEELKPLLPAPLSRRVVLIRLAAIFIGMARAMVAGLKTLSAFLSRVTRRHGLAPHPHRAGITSRGRRLRANRQQY